MNRDDRVLRSGLLLRQAHRVAAKTLEAALAPLGLGGRHFGVLQLLDRHGRTTQRDLVAGTGSDKAGMTRTVDDLDRRGYLRRAPDPDDRRLVHLELTDAGREAFRAARADAARAGEEIFAGITDAELDVLAELLARITGDRRPTEPGRSSRD